MHFLQHLCTCRCFASSVTCTASCSVSIGKSACSLAESKVTRDSSAANGQEQSQNPWSQAVVVLVMLQQLKDSVVNLSEVVSPVAPMCMGKAAAGLNLCDLTIHAIALLFQDDTSITH